MEAARRHSIAPVEYVNNLRRISVPKLEKANKRLTEGVGKLKEKVAVRMAKTTMIKKPRNPVILYLLAIGSLLFSLFMFGAQDELIRMSMLWSYLNSPFCLLLTKASLFHLFLQPWTTSWAS